MSTAAADDRSRRHTTGSHTIVGSPLGAISASALGLALAEERLQLRDAVLGVREQVRLHLRGETRQGEPRSCQWHIQAEKRRAEAKKR